MGSDALIPESTPIEDFYNKYSPAFIIMRVLLCRQRIGDIILRSLHRLAIKLYENIYDLFRSHAENDLDG